MLFLSLFIINILGVDNDVVEFVATVIVAGAFVVVVAAGFGLFDFVVIVVVCLLILFILN